VHVTGVRDERGGILVMAAVTLPVFLLICALLVDTGNWFVHKRQLQNRADAGALAAGVEYLSQLGRCQTDPPAAATDISDVAKRYAGDPDAAVPGPKYNEQIANQSRVDVAINDGASGPCTPQRDGSVWTDVRVRESDIGTLFAGFGLNLPSITADARVGVKQITGIQHGVLPFVQETGDYVGCVWAEFVDVSTGGPVSIIRSGGSHVATLTPEAGAARRWTADVRGLNVPTRRTAIGVNYWMGSKTGGSCNFSTSHKRQLTGDNGGSPTPIDWINVFGDDTPGSDAAPLLHHFMLRPGSCGGDTAGFVHASRSCTITFSAEVDHGPNPAPSQLTVTSSNGWCTTRCVGSVTAGPSSGSGTKTTYTGQLTYDPTAVTGSRTRSQDYTQVGQQEITASWTMTSGSLTSGTSGRRRCTGRRPCTCRRSNPCRGTFETDLPGNVVQATYVADPVNSSPLSRAELMQGGSPMPNSVAADSRQTGPFTVELGNTGVDEDHVVLIRGRSRGVGSQTRTVDCGAGGTGAAIETGCASQLLVDQTGTCGPPPPFGDASLDCLDLVGAPSLASFSAAVTERFATPCTTNRWVAGSSPANLSPSDPRFAYVALTPYGETAGNSRVPIAAFGRVYVTGGRGMSCPGDDAPPRGDDGGTAIWGHLVDVVTLSDDALAGDEACDVAVALVNCKPELVR
jgi:Putative Flp pilus-assembly TadE/G-like